MKIKLLIVWLNCALFYSACLDAQTPHKPSFDMVLIASTPGDSLIKSALGIDQNRLVDFIRWDVGLNVSAVEGSRNFELHINYGESQPNTMGFKNGGEKKTVKGTFTISKSSNSELMSDVYNLTTSDNLIQISFIKLNDNLYHLLTPNHTLMVGNGGWSYSLNRKESLKNASSSLPILTPSVSLLKTGGFSEIFEGRTPCSDIDYVYNLNANSGCLKIKWKLTLLRDSITALPTTYIVQRTQHRLNDIVGKWTILKGYGNNADAVVYQLDADQPDKTFYLLVGSDNVLFFLDKKQQLLVGDSNFSYTLNRRQLATAH